jgi:hypothetical protein
MIDVEAVFLKMENFDDDSLYSIAHRMDRLFDGEQSERMHSWLVTNEYRHSYDDANLSDVIAFGLDMLSDSQRVELAHYVASIPAYTDEQDDDFEEFGDGMTDAEADADTLASAGWGTDEDYGLYGGQDDY